MFIVSVRSRTKGCTGTRYIVPGVKSLFRLGNYRAEAAVFDNRRLARTYGKKFVGEGKMTIVPVED